MKLHLNKFGFLVAFVMMLTLFFNVGIIYAAREFEDIGGPPAQENGNSMAGASGQSDSNGQNNGSDAGGNVPAGIKSMLGQIESILAMIALFVCTFKIIQIGIMFMFTAANERGAAKMAMVPWIIGAMVCGGYVIIGNAVITVIQNAAGGGIFDGVSPEKAVNDIGTIALEVIRIVAGGTAICMLVYIGIKYIFAGAGGMAKVKTNLLPWIVGLVLVSSASRIAVIIMAVAKQSGGDMATITRTVINMILGLLTIIAGAGAVGMLMFIGIKYMTKGAGAKAEVKNTILPWLIGCVLVSSASGIVNSFVGSSGGSVAQSAGNNTATTETTQSSTDWRGEVAQ